MPPASRNERTQRIVDRLFGINVGENSETIRRGGFRFVLPLENELHNRLRWFVWLRAHAAVLASAAGVVAWRYDLGISGANIVLVAAAIAAYNVFFLFATRRDLLQPIFNAHLQITLDWIALIVLTHETGGVNSPVLMFFVFHVIFAALLVPGFGAYVHAGIATVVVAAMGFLESTSVIRHKVPVWTQSDPPSGFELLVLVAFFGVVMFVSAFIAWTTANHLRALERGQVLLQRRLTIAVDSLQEANRDLIAMDEDKSRYTRTVTHQLRGPLSSVQSILRVILDGYSGVMDVGVRGMIERAERRVRGLIETVGDLLSVTELDYTVERSNPTHFNVADMIRALLEQYQPTVEVKRITLVHDLPDPLMICADPEDIERAIDNLIDNALKYTPENGQVTVSGRVAENTVSIDVTDTGIGIPPDVQEKLFHEFYRAPNAKQHEPVGTGLGLVIVKRAVERWSGSVAVSSDGSSGTRFTLTFPESGQQCNELSGTDYSEASQP
jgi:signal transduction histidine kinase